MSFTKYGLSVSQITKLARLCVQEQGSLDGVKAEASLMANLLETSPTRQKKYGTDGTGLYNFVRNGGWFYRAAYYMDDGEASAKYVEAVKDVLCNGRRTLPQYVDEHDCFSDIKSISTGSITDRSDYIQNVTVIRNKMGSVYTFYCFPAKGSDPFGYTKAAYNYVKEHGGEFPPEPEQEKVKVTTELPVIQRGDEGDAVAIWQIICGAKPDGDFGPTTQAHTLKLQSELGLTADGIVGAKTWAAGLSRV